MLYKPHTPMELGDAALGQLVSVLLFVFDHMIPAVHNVVSWETDDIDLGPIIPGREQSRSVAGQVEFGQVKR
ncbi:hypothetical protein PHMEG_00028911 [Phytophthora megakarya]|uniref:Uncharacterized protein n=1 Tax=Phytophthora megakarya TaxID=4795 RepID=A0A225V4H9_9STRA|nr:hypothetical protein PHMEG_00028911 [Phytophthora megakarya]